MKKFLLYTLLVVVVLAIGLYITMQYFLGGIVKKGVNKFGPAITQTKVELQSANISPMSGDGTLSGLSVGNPAGWSQTDAFRLGKVHINLEPFSVFKDHIVINDLTIERPEFFYETKLVASNVGDLMKNIEKSIGGKEAAPQTKEGKPIKLVVKRLVLKDGQVVLSVGGQTTKLPLPQIDMADLGVNEGGLTPQQLAVAVMRNVTSKVIAAVSTQGINNLGATGGGAAIEGAKQIGEAIKGIFGGGEKKK